MSSTIVWFRQDLRLHDNPALVEGVKKGKILPVYILDDDNAGDYKMGAASRVWLHHILNDLNENLDGNLHVFSGDAKTVLKQLVDEHRVDGIYWNRCYEPWRIKRDKDIKAYFEDEGLDVQSFQASLLWEPWEIQNQSGDNYKVFTPFYKKGCLNADEPREPLDKPSSIDCLGCQQPASKINDLNLIPADKDWPDKMIEGWDISESGAQKRLDDFLDEGLKGYKGGRNNPGQNNVSRLSPYLHWGLISPHTAWHTVRPFGKMHHCEKDMEHFCSELGWREFSYSLLYNYPDLPENNLQEKFNKFPWRYSENDLKKWQRGQTGCPMVDAGMRELYETGYMHNRMRMTVGSFLVKNLMMHWHHGEAWFWDCLADADLANNSASWQWIAGCGADAAPYFRIFNPVLQGKKFDEDGEYVRKYVPELKDLPNKYLFSPWEAPEEELEKAGVKLGETYPELMVDLKESRDRALDAYSSIKGE